MNKNYIPVKDKKMVRDVTNKALLSTDLEGLQAYKMRRQKSEDHDNRINNMEDKMKSIETMLKQILEKLN
jgi:hypothetical protein